MRLMPKAALLAVLLAGSSSFAQNPELTFKEYEAELASLNQRAQTAREQIAQEQAQIEKLKQDLSNLQKQISSVLNEKYSFLGITGQDVINAESELESLKNDAVSLSDVSRSELTDSILIRLEKRYEPWKTARISRLPQISSRVAQIGSLLSKIRISLESFVTAEPLKSPEPSASVQSSSASFSTDNYTVGRDKGEPESLFKIAKSVYGDPFEWPRIYRANKENIEANFRKYQAEGGSKITNPHDLIIPGQVLQIPR